MARLREARFPFTHRPALRFTTLPGLHHWACSTVAAWTFMTGGGAGIRFVASESERINLGIDYARASDGDSAVYFRIGEAF